MDAILMAYTWLGVFSVLALVIFILKIAGTDMVFALYRYFKPRGCDIFITNSNRQIERHFQVAKSGTFVINGQTYLTNPNKLEGLSDDMKKTVEEKLSLKRMNLEKGILLWQEKKRILLEQIQTIEEGKKDKANIPILEEFKLQLAHINEQIVTIEAKIKDREQSYYLMRRPCYLYIEDDPVPKDLYEWRTDIDTVQLDNIILRAQTKDPKGIEKFDKDILLIKKVVLGIGILTLLAIFMAIKNGSYIQQIGTHLGVVFKLG